MEKLIIKDDREELANQIKEIVCSAMQKEGFVSAEDAKHFMEHYAVVFRTKGWFGRILGNFFGEPEDNNMFINVVKMVDIRDENSSKDINN